MKIISAKYFNEESSADVTVPRFAFDDEDEAEAIAACARLNRAARTAWQFNQLPTARRLPNHAARVTTALAVLNALDPAGTFDSQYSVATATAFVAPTEDPPADEMETAFRSIRDSGA